MANAETIDPARLAELHAIVKDLHAGKSVEEVKPRFEELIQDVEATEIAAMEQKLIEGGVPDTEVKRLCDVHVQVFADALEGHAAVTPPPGHPLDTFQRENQALLQVTASLRKVAEAIGEPPDGAAWGRLKGALSGTVARLAEIDKHYLRKENQLFPVLEAKGVSGPSKVMWAVHDDIRILIKDARARGRRRHASRRPAEVPRDPGARHGLQGGAHPLPDGARAADRGGVGEGRRGRGRDRLRVGSARPSSPGGPRGPGARRSTSRATPAASASTPGR